MTISPRQFFIQYYKASSWNRPSATLAAGILRPDAFSRSARGLFSRETRWLANGTQVETRKSPLPLLLDKHQRGAKLPLNAVAAISSILDLTADQDGCIVV